MDKIGWEIEPYEPSRSDEWNEFVRESRNGTFLFERGYMDYHSDRFRDASLMATYNGKLAAILPACVEADTLYSHKGLTYGGWLFPMRHIDAGDVLSLFSEWHRYSSGQGWRKCVYKAMPYIYSRRPSQEDLYALFRCGARLIERNLSAAIYLPDAAAPASSEIRNLNAARRAASDCRIVQDDGTLFYPLLCHCLEERHSALPVHSEKEFRLLSGKFPDNIVTLVIERGGKAEAGICIFLTHTTAHCQYTATTPHARKKRLLNLLTAEVRKFAEERKLRYLDFGTSNEDHGRVLNEGLYYNKFSYGAGGVAYEIFEMDFKPDPLV